MYVFVPMFFIGAINLFLKFDGSGFVSLLYWLSIFGININSLIEIFFHFFVDKTRKKYVTHLIGDNDKIEVICGFDDWLLTKNKTYTIDNISHGHGRYPCIMLGHFLYPIESKEIYYSGSSGIHNNSVFKLLLLKDERKLKLLKLGV